MTEIVIVEDNPELIEFVKLTLAEKMGVAVRGFTSGAAGLAYIEKNKPDLVIIDLGLSDIRGESVCEAVRAQYTSVPIVILTGEKSTQSVVNCLNVGADDYITKPFEVAELVARINARLRNQKGLALSGRLKAGTLELDQDAFTVAKNGKSIELTAKEFELLRYLLLHKGTVVTRDKVLAAVWGYSSNVDTRVVDVHIGKLRKKILDYNNSPLIRTVRGFGYKISN